MLGPPAIRPVGILSSGLQLCVSQMLRAGHIGLLCRVGVTNKEGHLLYYAGLSILQNLLRLVNVTDPFLKAVTYI